MFCQKWKAYLMIEWNILRASISDWYSISTPIYIYYHILPTIQIVFKKKPNSFHYYPSTETRVSSITSHSNNWV